MYVAGKHHVHDYRNTRMEEIGLAGVLVAPKQASVKQANITSSVFRFDTGTGHTDGIVNFDTLHAEFEFLGSITVPKKGK